MLETLLIWWLKKKIRGYVVKKLVTEIFMGAVRHSLTAFGLVFVNSGLATADEANALAGALAVIAGFAWSVYRKWKRET